MIIQKSCHKNSSNICSKNQMIDTNPDMYGVRRSSRSRKEPDRYTVREAEESDEDMDIRKSHRNIRKAPHRKG